MKILETKNLVKRFNGIHAVDRLSIGIEKGSITGIVGPNGSGKTTFINLLSGVLKIDSGQVVIEEAQKFTRILPHQISLFGITRTFQNIKALLDIASRGYVLDKGKVIAKDTSKKLLESGVLEKVFLGKPI